MTHHSGLPSPPLLCSLEASAHGQRPAGGEGHCDALDLRGSPFPLSRAPPVSMHIRPVGGRGFYIGVAQPPAKEDPRQLSCTLPAPLSPSVPTAWPLLNLELPLSACFPFSHLSSFCSSIIVSWLLLFQTSASSGSKGQRPLANANNGPAGYWSGG